jgi:4-hydroxybutyrate CoA-transferase
VVTNRLKAVHPGRSVTELRDRLKEALRLRERQPEVEFHPADRTNDTALIGKNRRSSPSTPRSRWTSPGQVCADSIGHRIYSGIGGQMDFIRGAARSRGWQADHRAPVHRRGRQALAHRATLTPGAGVVTTRGHVHWIVTEYGAVNLHGKTLRERAEPSSASPTPTSAPSWILEMRQGSGTFVADVPTETRAKEKSVAAQRFVRQMLTEAARQGLSPSDLHTALERELPESK